MITYSRKLFYCWPFLAACGLMGLGISLDADVSYTFAGPLALSSFALSKVLVQENCLEVESRKIMFFTLLKPKNILLEGSARPISPLLKKNKPRKTHCANSIHWDYYAMINSLVKGKTIRPTAKKVWNCIRNTYTKENPFVGKEFKIYFDTSKDESYENVTLMKQEHGSPHASSACGFPYFQQVYSSYWKLHEQGKLNFSK